jgi:rRNA maturation endonuclease Nob1
MQPLLVSDANIPIDIEHGNLTASMFSMKITFTVPDVLFEKELRARHSHLLDFGLKIKSLSDEAVDKAIEFAAKYRQPSRIDLFALSLALQENCPLLTGDKNLRKAAKQEGVQVHGTIWLVGEMLREKIIQPTVARTAFQKMKDAGSRLPWAEVNELLDSGAAWTWNPTNGL